MSFFPILKAPHCSGKTTIYNYPPNNWERFKKTDKFLSLTFLKDNEWHSTTLDFIKYKQTKKVDYSDVLEVVQNDTIALLSLSDSKLPKLSNILPQLDFIKTITPNYRATLELCSKYTSTSYQGEIDAFPPKASLLTFSPFLQFGDNVENYLLLINLENNPVQRECIVEIYDSDNEHLLSSFSSSTNNINIISLDNIGINEDTLPFILCRTMAAIPLYFTCTKDGKFLSLEHTHPPFSLVAHGNRFAAQNIIKSTWFNKLDCNVKNIK